MLIYVLCNCKFKAYLFIWKIINNEKLVGIEKIDKLLTIIFFLKENC